VRTTVQENEPCNFMIKKKLSLYETAFSKNIPKI
jgi:hypothetical protein